MIHKGNSARKILPAVLLVAALFFGGSIVIAIANWLPADNPLHFWLPPAFMVSWFFLLIAYLSHGKRAQRHKSLTKSQTDERQKTAEDVVRQTSTQAVSTEVEPARKIHYAVLLVTVLLFGGLIVVTIANSLPADNPLHFWLLPVFMVSWFCLLIACLSHYKRAQGQESPTKSQTDEGQETAEDVVRRTSTQAVSTEVGPARPVDAARENQPESTPGQKHNKYLIACIVAWVVLFMVLILGTFLAGGTAAQGKIRQGRFYLGGGGDYTQVSPLGYTLSAVHTLILGALFPFAAYAACSMSRKDPTIKMRDDKFRLIFVVFASFIGCYLAIDSLICCILAALTVLFCS
ncbi:MAG: hypothetical protein ACYSUP_13310 [Planctomycetota bacterium]|jgi:predicted secreted protein